MSLHAYKFPATCRGDRAAKKSGSRLTCVAVSRGVVPDTGYEYCIGCQVPLWFDFDGATAYKKVQDTE